MGRYSRLLAPPFADCAGIAVGQRALDVGCGPGALTVELVERLGAHAVSAVDPLVAMQLRRGDVSMAFFSTITQFATPRDVTLQQLKIECFFPADYATEQLSRRLAEPHTIAV